MSTPEATTSENFDEKAYLAANPDVARAVRDGSMPSGWHHYQLFGADEGRQPFTRRSTLPAGASRWIDGGTRRARSVGDRIRSRRGPTRADDLAARVADLEVEIQQLRDLLELGHGIQPPPPKHLQVRVVGNFNAGFVRSGFDSSIPLLERGLAPSGRSLDSFERILDFGCGSGRTLFALRSALPDAELSGVDIDAEAIDWLRSHRSGQASYDVAPTEPPTSFDDARFDFVFGISVFTHLPEQLQLAWLAELRPITRPGGHLLLTTHGSRHSRALPVAEQERLDEAGFLYLSSGYGESVGLPSFYESAYHTHDYVRATWSRWFDVVAIQEPTASEHQDLVLLRVPD